VRHKIGIQIVDGEYYFTYPSSEQVKVLKKIVLDLATKAIKVDAVKSKEQQIAHVDGIPMTSMPGGQKLQSAEAVSDLIKVHPPITEPKYIRSHSPLDRKNLVPKSFGLSISNTKAAQLFYELRNLNIDKFPIAAAVSLRSFVEAVVEIYCSTNSIAVKHTSGTNAGKAFSLAEKVESVLQHVTPNMTKQDVSAARASLTGKTSVISVARPNTCIIRRCSPQRMT
jgi:hypothetical protein